MLVQQWCSQTPPVTPVLFAAVASALQLLVAPVPQPLQQACGSPPPMPLLLHPTPLLLLLFSLSLSLCLILCLCISHCSRRVGGGRVHRVVVGAAGSGGAQWEGRRSHSWRGSRTERWWGRRCRAGCLPARRWIGQGDGRKTRASFFIHGSMQSFTRSQWQGCHRCLLWLER